MPDNVIPFKATPKDLNLVKISAPILQQILVSIEAEVGSYLSYANNGKIVVVTPDGASTPLAVFLSNMFEALRQDTKALAEEIESLFKNSEEAV